MSFALSQTGSLVEILNIAGIFIAGLEAGLVSVERLSYYSEKLPKEALARVPASDPKNGEWPCKGEIEIDDLEIRYATREKPVICGLSVKIRRGEKVGIVGRTGSGKSSLLLALFRIVEPSRGKIVIDGLGKSDTL
jgi:ABC-type multidrug transport system fused ATPase/permease subunit